MYGLAGQNLGPPYSDGPKFMVGVRGLEPPASCSQSTHATNCVTPRHLEQVLLNNYRLKLNAFLRFYSSLEVMLERSHLRNHVGLLHQPAGSAASGKHQVRALFAAKPY